MTGPKHRGARRRHLAGGACLVLLLGAGTANARQDASGPTCGAAVEPLCDLGEDPGAAPAAPVPGTTAGNPVSLVTGAKIQTEVDFALEGAPLGFRRHYRSSGADDDVGVGQGWRHTWLVSLAATPEGGLRIVDSTGRHVHFDAPSDAPTDASTGDGAAGAGGGRRFPARVGSDGHVLDTGEGHVWVVPDGRRLSFRGALLARIDWPDHRRVRLDYERLRVARVTDETGRALALEYTPGRPGLPGYDPEPFRDQPGHLAAVVLPDGTRIEYDYDERRNLTRARFADGTARTYRYEDPLWSSHLTGLVERTGTRFATWAYDDDGRAVLSERAGGAGRVRLAYELPDAVGGTGRTAILNTDGATSTYAWRRDPRTGASMLLSARGPGCTTCPPTGRDYAWDADGRLGSTTFLDDEGAPARTLHYAHDARGRLVEVVETDALGARRLVERRAYDGAGTRPVRVERPSANPSGVRAVETALDADGLVLSITERGFAPDVAALAGAPIDPSGRIGAWVPIERTTTLVHEAGRLVAVDGPRDDVDDVTRLEWDRNSRLVAIRPPASPAAVVESFDAAGRATTVRIGTASPFVLTRNARGDVASVTQRGATLAYEHDAEGRLVATVDPDGRRTELARDAAGRVARVTDDLGRVTALVRDGEGRVTVRSLAGVDGVLMRAVAYAFDARGRLVERTSARPDGDAGGTRERTVRHGLDRLGRPVSIVDPATGASLSIDVDAALGLAVLTRPDGATTTLGLDALGRDVSVTDARDNRTVHLKDDFGRIVLLDSPDAGRETRAHDAAGNMILRTRDDAITGYRHDAAGRLVRREGPDGVAAWRFDPSHGRLVEARNAATSAEMAYDIDGRLVEHVRRIDGHAFATGHARDERGRVVEKRLPDGQRLRRHHHEDGPNRGALRAITRSRLFGLRDETIVAEVDQDARDGDVGHLSHGGLRVSGAYDAAGELDTLEIARALRAEYRFDDGGRIAGIVENGLDQRYGYRKGRLTSAETPLGSYRYAYDAAGNRTAKRVRAPNGRVTEERYGLPVPGAGNRLLGVLDPDTRAEREYRYAGTGAPVVVGELSYAYDAERRPVEVRRGGALVARYAYDAFGQRVRKAVYGSGASPTITYFLYDGGALTAEIDGDGAVIAQYVYLDGHRPVARISGSDVHAIHVDHRGAPRLMTDGDGAAVWRASYAPFGAADVTLAEIDLPLRLPGQYEDVETGTHHNYLRDYDPATGRYLTSDPIGLLGGLDAYGYVGGDPLSGVDPWGLYLVAFDGTWNTPASNTNVSQMLGAYRSGERQYNRGVGTDGGWDQYLGGGLGIGARDRVNDAIRALQAHLESSDDTEIDIIGFSRGSASAREFANRITVMQANGEFAQPFTIRFMGLFDTVATNLAEDPGNSAGLGSCITYDLSIPDSVQYVAHATALNEFRALFPQSSIGEDGSFATDGPTRVEAGFIGAHSDIGGGYDTDSPGSDGGDLSDVALNWMVEQARLAGVDFELTEAQRTVSNPILHDERGRLARGFRTDRQVMYPNDPEWVRENRAQTPDDRQERIEQRDSPDYSATRPFVRSDGTVDMDAYARWLEQNRGITVQHERTGARP